MEMSQVLDKIGLFKRTDILRMATPQVNLVRLILTINQRKKKPREDNHKLAKVFSNQVKLKNRN